MLAAPRPGRARRLPRMDVTALRAAFPVLERVAYLNSGTDGPLPAAAVAAAQQELESQARDGRLPAHFERRVELQAGLRSAYARLLAAPVEQIALTTSATDGLGRVIAGLGLDRGDEIVTSDQEHPGLLGPLLAARRRGVNVRAVPLAHAAEAVGPETKLVAISHVSWIGGDGTVFLWIDPAFAEQVAPVNPGYVTFEDPAAGLAGAFKETAARFDTPAQPREAIALSLA